MRKFGSKRDRQTGGAAVEFAIVLPVFCLLIFGVIDYGWYFYQRFALSAAVRDGVRLGVTQTTDADKPWTKAKERADIDLTNSNVSKVGIIWGPETHVSGEFPNKTLTMTVSIPFQPLVGFVKVPPSLFASVSMLLELQ